MGIFNIFKKRKEENNILRFNNLKVHYITERLDGLENVIGKDGYVSINDGLMIVCCQGKVVFKGEVYSLTASELLSHDGVIFSGFDIEKQEERVVVIYFKYYRK